MFKAILICNSAYKIEDSSSGKVTFDCIDGEDLDLIKTTAKLGYNLVSKSQFGVRIFFKLLDELSETNYDHRVYDSVEMEDYAIEGYFPSDIVRQKMTIVCRQKQQWLLFCRSNEEHLLDKLTFLSQQAKENV